MTAPQDEENQLGHLLADQEEDIEDCVACERPQQPPSREDLLSEDEGEDGKPDTRGVLASVLTLLLSLPALVGSCCWPLLLAGVLGITASAGAKSFAHSISFGVTLAALTNLAQYVAWKAGSRTGTHWRRYGPLYLVAASVPLVMADLTRHVLQDSDIWPSPSSDMYRPHCNHSVKRFGGIYCLSVVGWLFTIVFTYLGFACMILGVFWAADLGRKVRVAWRQLRKARRRRQ